MGRLRKMPVKCGMLWSGECGKRSQHRCAVRCPLNTEASHDPHVCACGAIRSYREIMAGLVGRSKERAANGVEPDDLDALIADRAAELGYSV